MDEKGDGLAFTIRGEDFLLFLKKCLLSRKPKTVVLRALLQQGEFMLGLWLASVLFAASHLGIAGTRLRNRLTALLGEAGYSVAYSILSLLLLVWMVRAYGQAPYRPLWGNPDWAKPLAVTLMLPAFLLVVGGLTTPNPTAVAQENAAAAPPRGIVTVTRHPFLIGVALWAALHLLANGDTASLAFFGALGAVAITGLASIDAKRRRKLGASWEEFARQTSVIPFAAIFGRRAHLDLAGIGVWRPLAGVALYALMLWGHRFLIGVSPFQS